MGEAQPEKENEHHFPKTRRPIYQIILKKISPPSLLVDNRVIFGFIKGKSSSISARV